MWENLKKEYTREELVIDTKWILLFVSAYSIQTGLLAAIAKRPGAIDFMDF